MEYFNLKNKLSLEGLLSAFSFVLVSSLLILYIFGKVYQIESINRIFNSSESLIFIWILGIFVILSNLGYIRDVLRSTVKERIDSLVISDIREELRKEFSNDPDILDNLEKARLKREKQSFAKEPDNINIEETNNERKINKK